MSPVSATIVAGAHAHELIDLIARPGDQVVSDQWYGPRSVCVCFDQLSTNADPTSCEPTSSEPTNAEPRLSAGVAACPHEMAMSAGHPDVDVVRGLLRAVRRKERPGQLLLVVGPRVDLCALIDTVCSDADLQRHIRLDGVTLALDGAAASAHLAVHRTIGTRTTVEAASMVDTIAIGRSSALTKKATASLREALRGLSPTKSTMFIELPDHPIDPVATDAVRRAVLGLGGTNDQSRAAL